jgi:hypothetical protein
MIPVVIVHENYQEFLKSNVEITGKNNSIFLIGNESVKVLEDHPSVTYVDIKKYLNMEKFKLFEKNFIHYGDKDRRTYMFWFMRMLIMSEFAKEYELESFFSCDSDNTLLVDVNNFNFKKENAITIPDEWEPFYYGASVHSGLISSKFCNVYEDLITSIFLDKKKIDFIEDKINFHKTNPGSFCDMTLYFYMSQFNLIDFDNLMIPRSFKEKEFIFTQSYANGEGIKSRDQYKLRNKKMLIKRDNKLNANYILDKKTKEKFYIANIHFQGKQKKYLNSKMTKWLNY